MPQPLVVGLGRAGAGLHLKVLSRALANESLVGPVVACDPLADAAPPTDDVRIAPTLADAARLLTPESTVVHLCTPPGSRAELLRELGGLGFRQILLEKPLASNLAELAEIEHLQQRYRLRIRVVAHWLSAELTHRLAALIDCRELLSISIRQHKPRILRSLRTRAHPTAFDVEIPHSLGLVLRLAGDAEVVDAECTDLVCGDTVVPWMGSARLDLRHTTGVTTRIVSDLTSPVRERSVRLDFADGAVVGHYPISEQDDHAQLLDAGRREVFRDDALLAFVLRTYRAFESDPTGEDAETANFALYRAATRLLCTAKQRCGANTEGDGHVA